MNNLTLRHLVDYIESTKQLKRAKSYANIPPCTVGQGDYGISQEPYGVLTDWIPPITVLPPKDYSTRGYND